MAIYTVTNKKKSNTKSKKILAITLISLSLILLLLTAVSWPKFIGSFFLGVFGIMFYPMLILMFLIGLGLLTNRRFMHSKKYAVYLFLAFLCIVAIIHVAVTSWIPLNSNNYLIFLGESYTAKITPGGLFVSLLTYPITELLNNVAAYVVFAIGLVILIALIIDYLHAYKQFAKLESTKATRREQNDDLTLTSTQPINITMSNSFEPVYKEKPQEDLPKTDTRTSAAREKLGLGKNVMYRDYANQKPATLEEKKQYIKTPDKNDEIIPNTFGANASSNWMGREMSTPVETRPPKFVYEDKPQAQAPTVSDYQKTNNVKNAISNRSKEYLNTLHQIQDESKNPIINAEKYDSISAPKIQPLYETSKPSGNIISSTDDYIKPSTPKFERAPEPDFPVGINSKKISPLNPASFASTETNDSHKNSLADDDMISNTNDFDKHSQYTSVADSLDKQFNIPQSIKDKRNPSNAVQTQIVGTEKIKKGAIVDVVPKYRRPSNYNRPPIELLPQISTDITEYESAQQQNIIKLENALAEFGIAAKVVAVRRGPAVTRYELSMPMGVTVKKLLAHYLDISLALAAPGRIRIEAPILGKNAVGIEVPNSNVDIVGLRDIVDSEKFKNAYSPLSFAVGKDIDGNIYVGDIIKMPHLLVAGATGSGKSVALNSMLISLLYKTSPDDLKLIIIDPKRVEFTMFNDLPHMLLPKAISDNTKAINALSWVINEMERRYVLFQEAYVKNIAEYNNQNETISGTVQKLPYILVIVDEFGDLMAGSNRKEFEEKIIKLTQKARAAGIHLILATQRPDVSVITGTIKVNLPSRMAFAVKTFEDSRTILGSGGADKLLGRGDMLYSFNNSDPVRVQGAYVDTKEIIEIINYVKSHNESYFDSELEEAVTNFGVEEIPEIDASNEGSGGRSDFDPVMKEALRTVIESGQASISMLQRRFSLGFSRAARVIDQMELAKFISPADGSKTRNVYITMEQFKELFGE